MYNKDVKNYLNRFDEILYTMSNKMLSYNMTGNITSDFIYCMIPHHQAAIYMCKNLLKYTTLPSLKQIAYSIIRMQAKEVKQMKIIVNNMDYYYNSLEDVQKYISKYYIIVKNMIYKMKHSNRGDNIDLNFISEMIPHHEGAILMCKNVLKYYIDPRIVKMANEIIEQQSKGIEQLKDIRKSIIN